MGTKQTEEYANTIAQQCIAVRLRLLNRVITNLFDDALRDLGVKVSQLNILVATAKMGVARPAEVCDKLQLDSSTLSRNVKAMLADSAKPNKPAWLEIVPEEQDGRERPFRLTSAGRALLQQALPAWHRAQTQARELLGEQFVALLDQAVTQVRSTNTLE